LQLALVLQILLVFKITLLLYKNEKIAFAASLIYFSFPITVIAVRTLTTDAYLTTFILASIYFWLQYKEQHKSYLLYLFYISLGLIFETKGPVGLIVPITLIISQKIVTKDKIEISIHQFLGLLLFLLVSSAWYLTIINKNAGLFDYFFNNQLVERVLENKFKRGKPFWYYILLMPLLGLPWLFLLVFYFKKNLKTIITKKTINYVLLMTFTILFLVLTISTSKLILYVLPLYFIIAIFSANYLSESSEKVIKNTSKLFIALTTFITFTVVVMSLIRIDNIKINTKIAILNFIIFTIGSVVINKKTSNLNFLKTGYLSVAFILSILFSSINIFAKNELKINSVKPIATFIKAQGKTKNKVLVYNYLLPSLSFYLDKNIITINHGRYTTQREVQFETNKNWKKNLINYFDKNDRARVLNFSPDQTIYLIKKKKDKLPDTLATLKSTLKHQKYFGKFEIFY
jgi:4-amino-4-deoxy-L-arabinose transferase